MGLINGLCTVIFKLLKNLGTVIIMKDLILHIRFNKTATSSIQETLARSTYVLSKHGVYFPIFCGLQNQ